MSLRMDIIQYSRGDHMDRFWRLYKKRRKAKGRFHKNYLDFLLARSAHKHGGYIGVDAEIDAPLRLPHGLHGIFISRYAKIGKNCWIYQNVTIGEVNGKAPQIGDDVLIGAGAVLVGDIKIGDGAKIGAGAVVRQDVPAGAKVIPAPGIIVDKRD